MVLAMRALLQIGAVLLVYTVCACDTSTSMDRGKKYVLDKAREDVKLVRAAREKGDDPSFRCMAILGAAAELEEEPSLGGQLHAWRQLCAFDAPRAWADTLIRKLESGVRPDASGVMAACFDLDRAIEHLDPAKTLNKTESAEVVKALTRKRKTLCP
jgi:hypothetical protein